MDTKQLGLRLSIRLIKKLEIKCKDLGITKEDYIRVKIAELLNNNK